MIREFSEELLKDHSISILYDFKADSEVLFMTFSGVGIGIGVPFFEFMKVLDQHDVKKILVRDVHKSWYHAGLIHLADSIDESVPVIQDLIKQSGAKKVVILGNSMGGYAAILYAALLGADEVLAFSPTTFANWKNRIRYLDYRQHFKYLKNAKNKPYHYYDLVGVPGMDKPAIHIYFDTDFRPDRNHALHLARSYANVTLHPQHGGKHAVIKKIKERGDLDIIIRDAIDRAQP